MASVERARQLRSTSRGLRPAVVYVGLALGLSWAVWVPALLADPDAGQWIAMVGAFGPAVAAAIMVRRGGGSIVRWARDIAIFGVSARWYVLAVGIPVGFVMIQVLAAALVGVPLALEEVPIRLVNFILTAAVVLFIGGGQEEPGWRGWLQPTLQQRMSPLTASAVVGGVWAVWHLPLFVFDFHFYAGLVFWLYLPTLVGLSVIATLLWNRTGGSVMVVMLFHAAVNASGGLLPVHDSQAADLTFAGQLVLTLAVLGAAGWIAWRRGRELGGRPRTPHGVP